MGRPSGCIEREWTTIRPASITVRTLIEAQNIAKDLGQTAWVTRASGELGLIAFLEGNPGRAARLLGSALLSTMTNGDTGGQIRFLELIGNGFEEVNRHAEALKFFDRAIKLAESEKDSGLPFIAYEGKGQALVALGKQDEARKVIEGMLISVAEPYWNSSVVGSMSETYLHHFELLNKSGDVPDAFNVLERVRGRTLTWALEDRRAIQASQPEQTAALESEVASLQLQLMQTSDSGERQQLLHKLDEIERRLGFACTSAH